MCGAILSFLPSLKASTMDLPLPDLDSLPGQQAYYLYGFSVLLLLLLLVVFKSISGPSKQSIAAKKVRGTSNVLFVGPMASGKTSLFGRVSMHCQESSPPIEPADACHSPARVQDSSANAYIFNLQFSNTTWQKHSVDRFARTSSLEVASPCSVPACCRRRSVLHRPEHQRNSTGNTDNSRTPSRLTIFTEYTRKKGS